MITRCPVGSWNRVSASSFDLTNSVKGIGWILSWQVSSGCRKMRDGIARNKEIIGAPSSDRKSLRWEFPVLSLKSLNWFDSFVRFLNQDDVRVKRQNGNLFHWQDRSLRFQTRSLRHWYCNNSTSVFKTGLLNNLRDNSQCENKDPIPNRDVERSADLVKSRRYIEEAGNVPVVPPPAWSQ